MSDAEVSSERTIRIYCPAHQIAFDHPFGPKINCEILDHSLSADFLAAEFWEYCCDCDTFIPSGMETGKSNTVCPNCQRPWESVFVCHHCQTACFDSNESSHLKKFQFDAARNTITPSCP